MDTTIAPEIRQTIYEEVVAEVEKQASLKIARRLLTSLDIVTISESTNLPIEEVESLDDEERKLRVLKISKRERRLQGNLANIARIFGEDVHDYHVAGAGAPPPPPHPYSRNRQ